VRLRPHLKTAKSVEVAELAFAPGDRRAASDGQPTAREARSAGAEVGCHHERSDQYDRCGAVSTLEEAAYFVARGVEDLTYAVGIAPAKLDAIAALGARVGVLTDDLGAAGAIAAHPGRFDVWIEIDSGQHRGGLAPEDPTLIELARVLEEAPRVALRGVLTHAGHSYSCRGADAIAGVAEVERRSAVEAAERLRAAGIPCPEVSVGSTPTAVHARSLEGVTELRAGVHVFGDLFQAAIGSCTRDDLALSVLTTVIGRRDDAVWIDAGALALTQDRSLDGYGEVVGLELEPLPGLPRVDALNQVHGRVVATSGALDRDRLAVGSRVRVLPNHACLTAAMFDRYFVLSGGERPIVEWPRLRG
jgi:D-serine deaminase-like pyridoxal phosphate-dependent protein